MLLNLFFFSLVCLLQDVWGVSQPRTYNSRGKISFPPLQQAHCSTRPTLICIVMTLPKLAESHLHHQGTLEPAQK